MKRSFIALVISLVLLSLVATSCSRISSAAPTSPVPAPATSAASPITPTPAPLSVSALELSRAYDANWKAADSQYKGKELNITGVFYNVDHFPLANEVPHFWIYPSSDLTGWGIVCQSGTSGSYTDNQTSLPPPAVGQTITVNGIFEGVDPDYRQYLLLTDILIIAELPFEPPTSTPTVLPTTSNLIITQHLVSQLDRSLIVGENGPDGVRYNGINAFSPDGKHIAYQSGEKGQVYVVVDNSKGPIFENTGWYTFSPDSQRFAYAAEEDNLWFMVEDWKNWQEGKHYGAAPYDPSKPYEIQSIGPPVFSPDSQHLAYIARDQGHYYAVLDGVEGKPYARIENDVKYGFYGIVFSPDSRQMAYIASDGNQEFTVINGQEGKPYDHISGLVFSPDSRRVAYIAQEAGKSFAVIDGVEQSQEGVTGIVFSPDSQHVAFTAGTPGQRYIVVDGVAGQTYTDVSIPSFSPDSREVMYTATVQDKSVVVVNGRAGKAYDSVRSPVFSPDSQRFAYAAELNGKWSMVVDGVAGQAYDYVSSPVFSPDSQKVAYLAQDGNQWYAVTNNVQGRPYTYIYPPLVFSPDSQTVAYIAQSANKELVVVGKSDGQPWDHVLGGEFDNHSSLFFNSSSSLRYLAESGNDVYLVQWTIN